MTPEEKSSNLRHGVPRLGVPPWAAQEDTHGVGCPCLTNPAENSTGCPTTFPNGPSLGASFDRSLWTEIGQTIGLEARGLTNQGQGCTLYFLDPDINLLRDPRWGRAQEVPGEDPYLTGEYGSYIIDATQRGGEDPRYLTAAATMKHFAMYDFEGIGGFGTVGARDSYPPGPGPNTSSCDGWTQSPTDDHPWYHNTCSRMNFDAYPPARDYAGYYMRAFQTVVQRGKPQAIMCAYSASYGIPSCAHPINNDLVREEWGWDGFFISDCNAIEHFCGHNYSLGNSVGTNIAAALNQGGVDYNCGQFYEQNLFKQMKAGFIKESDLDRAVGRVLTSMFKLGMLDPIQDQIYPFYTPAVVDRPEARKQALRAAEEGSVLLKNDGILPLLSAGQGQKLAFIGPQANYTQNMLSAPQYHGQNKLVETNSPLMAAMQRGWSVAYAQGCNVCDAQPQGYPNMACDIPKSNSSRVNFTSALDTAKTAQVAVLFLGNDQTTEAENFDRRSLELPGAQQALLEAICTVQSNVVLVLQNGGPIAVGWAKNSSCVRAILDVFQPGELGGPAIMNLLSGDTVPSGKLPYTVYTEDFVQRRDIREMDLRAAGGVTSWWSTQPTLWPFGYGLSYTTFTYKWSEDPPQREIKTTAAVAKAYHTQAEDQINSGSMFHTVEVINAGHVTADCVVLAFLTSTSDSSEDVPLKRLFGFERLVAMAPGEQRSVTFASGPTDLSNVDEMGRSVISPGVLGVEVGDVVQPARREIALTGDKVVLKGPLPFTPRR